MFGSLYELIVVYMHQYYSIFFCRLEKVSVEVVRCQVKDISPILNQMEFSECVIITACIIIARGVTSLLMTSVK